jgi:hypothetical protein
MVQAQHAPMAAAVPVEVIVRVRRVQAGAAGRTLPIMLLLSRALVTAPDSK